MRQVISPILYAMLIIPVTIGTVVIVDLYEQMSMTGSEFVGLVGLLVVGGIFFGLVTKLLLKFEGTTQPKMLNHFRQSSLLYVAFLILSVIVGNMILYIVRKRVNPDIGMAWFFILWMVCLYGIVVNAVILYRIHRRNNQNASV